MKETVLTWTIANWITVFLMFVTASVALGIILKLITKARANREG